MSLIGLGLWLTFMFIISLVTAAVCRLEKFTLTHWLFFWPIWPLNVAVNSWNIGGWINSMLSHCKCQQNARIGRFLLTYCFWLFHAMQRGPCGSIIAAVVVAGRIGACWWRWDAKISGFFLGHVCERSSRCQWPVCDHSKGTPLHVHVAVWCLHPYL